MDVNDERFKAEAMEMWSKFIEQEATRKALLDLMKGSTIASIMMGMKGRTLEEMEQAVDPYVDGLPENKVRQHLKAELRNAFRLPGAAIAFLRFAVDQRADARSVNAKRGAKAMLERDPKQLAKTAVHELWRDYQSGRKLFRSQAAFIRHALAVHAEVQSERTIERWIKEWREARTDTAS